MENSSFDLVKQRVKEESGIEPGTLFGASSESSEVNGKSLELSMRFSSSSMIGGQQHSKDQSRPERGCGSHIHF